MQSTFKQLGAAANDGTLLNSSIALPRAWFCNSNRTTLYFGTRRGRLTSRRDEATDLTRNWDYPTWCLQVPRRERLHPSVQDLSIMECSCIDLVVAHHDLAMCQRAMQ